MYSLEREELVKLQKKRAGLHNGKSSQKTGKVINPKHNDDEREKNENVNEKAVVNNVYFNCLDGEYTSKTQSGKHSFNEAELIYYTEHYSEALEIQNQKYAKARQKSNIKTMADWLSSKRYAPTETILRVGNIDVGFADARTMKKMTDEYISALNEWSAAHNDRLHILDYALHADEIYIDDETGREMPSSTHVHIRCVWDYVDENGILRVGTEKGMEQAGVPLPNPKACDSRYNNRSITFTKEFRKKWQDILIKNGFDIELEPELTKRKAKDKQTFIAEKRAEKETAKALEMQAEAMKKAEESERVRRSYMARNAELDSRETELEVRERLLDEREKSMQAAYSEKIAEADKLKNMFKDGLAKLNERAAEIKSAKLRDEQIAKNTALRNRFVGAAMGGLYSGSSRQNEDENNYSK